MGMMGGRKGGLIEEVSGSSGTTLANVGHLTSEFRLSRPGIVHVCMYHCE